MTSEHLSYPSSSTEHEAGPSSSKEIEFCKDRIFVGNLSPTVDEFTLLQYFSKFGPISAFDFLFHHSGPFKGQPRGFAFIEYEHTDHADKAISDAHRQLLRGKKLIVTYATQLQDYSSNGGVVRRKTLMESGRPTALSMLKDKGAKRNNTDDKIALMEAKLRQMEATSLSAEPKAMSSSLPRKPKPSVAIGLPRKSTKGPSSSSSLPPLPPKPSVVDLPKPQVAPPPKPKMPEKKKPLLAGVKIVKRKPDTTP